MQAARGRGNAAIAREAGGHLDPVRTWRVRFADGGLAALADRVLGRCEPTTGIVPFMNLVTQVMTSEPYASAKRVFWIVDNGSSHRGQAAIDRLAKAFPNAVMVHTPVHASWTNLSRPRACRRGRHGMVRVRPACSMTCSPGRRRMAAVVAASAGPAVSDEADAARRDHPAGGPRWTSA